MYIKAISCSISGVPRTIHTSVLHSHRSSVSRLMEPNATTNPKGMENSSVRKNISIVVPNPLSSVSVTFISMAKSSPCHYQIDF